MQAARAAWSTPGGHETAVTDFTDILRKLADLRDAGVLTEEEFALKKADILGTGRASEG
jgi:hypothetical protein